MDRMAAVGLLIASAAAAAWALMPASAAGADGLASDVGHGLIGLAAGFGVTVGVGFWWRARRAAARVPTE